MVLLDHWYGQLKENCLTSFPKPLSFRRIAIRYNGMMANDWLYYFSCWNFSFFFSLNFYWPLVDWFKTTFFLFISRKKSILVMILYYYAFSLFFLVIWNQNIGLWIVYEYLSQQSKSRSRFYCIHSLFYKLMTPITFFEVEILEKSD